MSSLIGTLTVNKLIALKVSSQGFPNLMYKLRFRFPLPAPPRKINFSPAAILYTTTATASAWPQPIYKEKRQEKHAYHTRNPPRRVCRNHPSEFARWILNRCRESWEYFALPKFVSPPLLSRDGSKLRLDLYMTDQMPVYGCRWWPTKKSARVDIKGTAVHSGAKWPFSIVPRVFGCSAVQEHCSVRPYWRILDRQGPSPDNRVALSWSVRVRRRWRAGVIHKFRTGPWAGPGHFLGICGGLRGRPGSPGQSPYPGVRWHAQPHLQGLTAHATFRASLSETTSAPIVLSPCKTLNVLEICVNNMYCAEIVYLLIINWLLIVKCIILYCLY